MAEEASSCLDVSKSELYDKNYRNASEDLGRLLQLLGVSLGGPCLHLRLFDSGLQSSVAAGTTNIKYYLSSPHCLAFFCGSSLLTVRYPPLLFRFGCSGTVHAMYLCWSRCDPNLISSMVQSNESAGTSQFV